MKLDLKAPHTVYKGADGRRLVGVTTYLSMIAKPQLFKWYADEERKGVLASIEDGTPLPDRPFAEVKRDKAADLGTVTHARIEAWLTGEELDPEGIPPEVYEQSRFGFDRFLSWWKSEGLTLLHSELVMVSDDPAYLSFGGTADIVATDKDGLFVLIDIKTTKKSRYWPYPETYAQVAAYASLYDWNHERVDRVVIVRIGKDAGDELEVVEVPYEKRIAGWKLFMAAYEAYGAKRELED
mgnify:CR=1 FL=1